MDFTSRILERSDVQIALQLLQDKRLEHSAATANVIIVILFVFTAQHYMFTLNIHIQTLLIT